MLRKNITYTNVDGQEVTETFYFNVTKAELLKLELSEDEGFKARIQRISEPGAKGRDIIDTFESILRHSYGVRTNEGKFIKSPQHFQEFMASEAYSELLFELATTADKSAEFVNAIMPASLAQEVEKMKNDPNAHNIFEDPQPAVQDVQAPHVANMENMSDEELLKAMGVQTTEGLTDDEILALSGAELATKPRAVLMRAYQLKNQR